MTPPVRTSGQITQPVLTEKIDRLTETTDRIECALTTHIEQERQNRERYLVDHAQLDNKANAAHTRIDRLEGALSDFQKTTQANIEALRVAVQDGEKQTASVILWMKLIAGILSPVGLAVLIWVLQQLLDLIKP